MNHSGAFLWDANKYIICSYSMPNPSHLLNSNKYLNKIHLWFQTISTEAEDNLITIYSSLGGNYMIDDRFIIQLQGKNFVTYEGLLDLAHQQGLESIQVDVVQFPTPENNMTAICRATAKAGERIFTDFGDASPSSVGQNLVPHILRMASTRAKARALRDLTNVGITALEELEIGDREDLYPVGEQMKTESRRQAVLPGYDPPTRRQLETIKDLSQSLNIPVSTENLNKKTADDLIAHLLDEKYKRH